jgi:energy-coupling factor transporter ATP-binding protein EcfA2
MRENHEIQPESPAMSKLLESLVARTWNACASPKRSAPTSGLNLGLEVRESQATRIPVRLPHLRRTEHLVVLGRTGSGKSSLLRALAAQDIRERRGFLVFDHHGDATPFVLKLITDEERRVGRDLSSRLIVIEPGDPEYSVGLNVLEPDGKHPRFRQVAECAAILRQRWQLDSLGARTEELLRNSLYVLADNHLTLLEVAPLLTSAPFRSRLLRCVENSDVRSFFESRYNAAKPGMQAAMSGPVLNKLSVFTADPHFRHLLGQAQSTFSLSHALDHGFWILLNLDKGQLGPESGTVASLFLAKVKNVLFARNSRDLFTLFCDEVQNLVSHESGLDVLFSEARKFGVGVASANQYLDQYPPQVRSAVLSVGTHIFFRLSSVDAEHAARALDGGRALAEILKGLPPRQFVAKLGEEPWKRVLAPTAREAEIDCSALLQRSRSCCARRRTEVEQEIAKRQPKTKESREEVLRDWE